MTDPERAEAYPVDLPLQIERDGKTFTYFQTFGITHRFDPDSITGRGMTFSRSFIEQLAQRGVLACDAIGDDGTFAPDTDGQVVVYADSGVDHGLILGLESMVWGTVQPLRTSHDTIGQRLADDIAGRVADPFYSYVFRPSS